MTQLYYTAGSNNFIVQALMTKQINTTAHIFYLHDALNTVKPAKCKYSSYIVVALVER